MSDTHCIATTYVIIYNHMRTYMYIRIVYEAQGASRGCELDPEQ